MDDELRELAAAWGVATWYEDTERRRVEVGEEVVIAVLGEMGVEAGSRGAVREGLARARAGRRGVPDPLVVRQGERVGVGGVGEVVTEGGEVVPVREGLPELPLGWHRLVVGERESTLVVTPRRLGEVPAAWGWQVQLYALRSAGSWGMGDLGDLREFVGGAGGAGVVLVNPVQAITPSGTVQRSPYSPSSRRFANPLYLRVTDTGAFQSADGESRRVVEGLAPRSAELIDYDGVWAAKLAALERLWAGQVRLETVGEELRDFATFCALAERHGADWRRWPTGLRHPANAEVGRARVELADRVAFHAWLQGLCAEQLDRVRGAARAAGMAVGVVHDLPIGVVPDGADAWALQDVLAPAVTVGAPPDAFSQQGQDWNLPPWRPDRLVEAKYRPFRDVIGAVLAHADGIRIDHAAGLWRLWWIPPGYPASGGTYVRYDAEALLGILALEAARARAIVVGEDLGTVPDGVTETLHERGMLSSAVLWFQRDEGAPGAPLLAPRRWPVDAMASISTHDLPTAAGFVRGEHVRVRAELGLLPDPGGEYERAAAERAELVDVLVGHGLLPADPSEEDLVVALHELLATAPSRLLLTSPQDALGDARQPNLPGTIDQYPNWRIPLPVSGEELLNHPTVIRAVAALRRARP